MEKEAPLPITGVILAGGRATRMGGVDKGLVTVAGRPMVEHIIERLKSQTAALLINANRSHDQYARYDLPVVADRIGDYAGPLAGMASGLQSATTPWIISVPCDSPLVPSDLVARLWAARQQEQADLAVAFAEARMQPVFALLPRTLLPSLEDFLDRGERKIDRWFAVHKTALAHFDDSPEAFLNINTPEDRLALEQRLVLARSEVKKHG